MSHSGFHPLAATHKRILFFYFLFFTIIIMNNNLFNFLFRFYPSHIFYLSCHKVLCRISAHYFFSDRSSAFPASFPAAYATISINAKPFRSGSRILINFRANLSIIVFVSLILPTALFVIFDYIIVILDMFVNRES